MGVWPRKGIKINGYYIYKVRSEFFIVDESGDLIHKVEKEKTAIEWAEQH